MAEISVSGRMLVKSLKKQFKDAYNATLRVYKGKAFAGEDDTLASIKTSDAKGGDLKISGNMLVGNFETKFKETFGITVQVANADDSKLSDNKITISAAGKE